MKKIKVIFRCDGNSSIGLGHVIRCLGLADMLREDFEIVFAVQQADISVLNLIRKVSEHIIELPVTVDYGMDASYFSGKISKKDIVVLDGYEFKTAYQKKIKEVCNKLVCIDDLHAWPQVADVVINHAEGLTPSAYSAESSTRFLLGLDYALLRSEFFKESSDLRTVNAVKKVFLSMGGADAGNLTHRYADAVCMIPGIEELHILVGAVNQNLEEIDRFIADGRKIKIIKHVNISAEELVRILKQCEVAICPASTISLECSAVGVGLISGYTAENQKGIWEGLKKREILFDLGDFNLLTKKDIHEKISTLITDVSAINRLIQNQKKLIDGKSPERIRKVFRSLLAGNIHFRFAELKDSELYFEWANDELVRSHSYKQEKINYEDHLKWFKSKLSSDNCDLFLFLNAFEEPVGQVRIEKAGEETVIGISVDKHFRGYSLGKEMLVMACEDYVRRNPDTSVVAYIKSSNPTSLKIFESAGFNQKEHLVKEGVDSYKLSYHA